MLFKNLINCNRHDCNKAALNVRSSGSSSIDRAQYYVELKRLWGEIFPPPHEYHDMERLSFQDFVLALVYISKYPHEDSVLNDAIDAFARYLGFSSACEISGKPNVLLFRFKNELWTLSSEVIKGLSVVIPLIYRQDNQENSGEEQRYNLTDEEKLSVFLQFLELVRVEKSFARYCLETVLFDCWAYCVYQEMYDDERVGQSNYILSDVLARNVACYAGCIGYPPEWLVSWSILLMADRKTKEIFSDMRKGYEKWRDNKWHGINFDSLKIEIDHMYTSRQSFISHTQNVARMTGIKKSVLSMSSELKRYLNSPELRTVDRNKVFEEIFRSADRREIESLIFKYQLELGEHEFENSEIMHPFVELSRLLYGFKTSDTFEEAKNILIIIYNLSYCGEFQVFLYTLGFTEEQIQRLAYYKGHAHPATGEIDGINVNQLFFKELIEYLKENENIHYDVKIMLIDMRVNERGGIFSEAEEARRIEEQILRIAENVRYLNSRNFGLSIGSPYSNGNGINF